MSRTRATRRGRPPLEWLSGDRATDLATGTAVSIERTGRHGNRLVGRILGRTIAGPTDTTLTITTTTGEVTVTTASIRRLRVVPSLYEPGDPVLRPGIPADVWRGGVVRTAGSDVLVEQLDGSFAWFTEADLEPAEARDASPLPALRRGPVPTEVR